MKTTLTLVLAVQVFTFVALGAHFVTHGEVRLGIAQLLLAVVQAVIYSGGLPD